MNELKKLDTFSLRDKYGWTSEAILAEAHATTVRRADMMNWQDVVVRDSEKASIKDGEFTSYFFEIWGLDNQALAPDQGKSKSSQQEESYRPAAREISP